MSGMTDIVETLKGQLRRGYELGDGSLCLVSARDLEAFIAEIERLRDKNQRLRAVMAEIYRICHIPSGSRHAYTHFQQDFDRIRELTKQ